MITNNADTIWLYGEALFVCVCGELEDDNYSKANTVTLHMNYLSALYTRISRPRFKQCLNKAKFFQIIVCFVDDCLFRICLGGKNHLQTYIL